MSKRVAFILKQINRALVGVLCASCMLPLSACVRRPPVVQSGVVVTPHQGQAYSEEVTTFAKGVIYDALEGYFKEILPSLTPEIAKRLNEQAGKIQAITAKAPLTETKYVELMQYLEENLSEYLGVALRLQSGESTEGELQILSSAYAELASRIGAKVLGEIIYELSLYGYDHEYETAMERYEIYGYAYLLADAQAVAAKKNTLQDEVGKENFISVTQMGCFLSELFFGGAFESGQVASFSDREILLMLKHPSFDSVTVGDEGWKLLFSYVNGFLPSENYAAALYAKASENGDVERFCAKMNGVLALLSAVQNKLTVEQAGMLRKNERAEAISSVFASFDEAEWALFEQVTSVELTKADYSAVAEAFYGEAFGEYATTVNAYTLQELKNAAGSKEFSEALNGYIAGISPAFSYGFTL